MIPLDPEDWVTVVADDLVKFVSEGGALVRFVVADSYGEASVAGEVLEQLASSANLYFFKVDAAERRIHYANDILACVAGQLDLRRCVTRFLLLEVEREGFHVPAEAEEFVLDEVALLNELVSADVVALLKQQIRKRVLSDSRLVRDMRFALSAMAMEILRGDEVASATKMTRRWLEGNVSRINELREFGIFQKVNRFNARAVLRSLLTWLPSSGVKGSILYIDARRLARPSNPKDGYVFYTRSALSDVYESIREFIDDTDEMHNTMLAFGMHDEFLSHEPSGRGMGSYQALQHRVSSFAEASLPNPLANVVLLSRNAESRMQRR